MRIPPLLLLTAVVVSLAPDAEAATVPVTNHPIGSGNGLTSAKSADIDADGDLDLVVADFHGDELSWWSNDLGDASAWTQTIIDGNLDGVVRVTTADLDGDGDLDVVASGGIADEVAWYANDGTGATWTKTVLGSMNNPRAPRAVDLDRDGDLDIVVCATHGSDVWWFEQTAGGFTGHLIDGAFAGARTVVPADIDADGDIDLVVSASSGNRVAWYENDGSQSFTRQTVATPSNPWGAAVADMDADGDLDVLATGRQSNVIYWWANDGSGGGWTQTQVASVSTPVWVEAVDYDGDGDVDVLGASLGGSVRLYENTDGVAGSFTTQTLLSASQPYEVDIADLDGDGDLDVAVPRLTGPLSWLSDDRVHTTLRSGAQTLIANAGVALPREMTTADIDADGDLDVIYGDLSADEVVILENDGTGAFPTETIVDAAANGAKDTDLADYDDDGDLDIVAGISGDDEVVIYENTGAGWIKNVVGAQDATSVEWADVDQDGDLDIVSAGYNDDRVDWFENGASWTRHAIGTPDGARGLDVGDVDSDGDLDLLVSATFGDDVLLYLGDGAGNFTEQVVDASYNGAAYGEMVDLDQDGDLDLLVPAESADDVHWWENDGTATTWTEHVIDGNVNGANHAFAVDIDVDGDLDVVATALNADDLIVYENTDGMAGAWFKRTVDGNLNGAGWAAAADFDADGELDLVAGAIQEDIVSLRDLAYEHATVEATGVALLQPQTRSTSVQTFEITATHDGRAGDSDIEIAELHVTFDNGIETAWTAAQVSSVVDSIDVFQDDGDGIWDPATDVALAGSAPSGFVATGGEYTLVMNDGDPAAAFAHGSSGRWWMVLNLAASAGISGLAAVHVDLEITESAIEDAAEDLELAIRSPGVEAATFPLNPDPAADAGGAGYSAVEGSSVTVDGSASSDDGTIVAWDWDCDGDGTFETLGAAPTNTCPGLADDGTVTLGLRVTDNLGATDTTGETLTVTNAAPTVALTLPTPTENIATTLGAVLMDAGSQDTHTWLWDFGDGTTSTQASPTHTYTAPGSYTVVVTVTDDDGGVGTDTDSVVVANAAPVAEAGPGLSGDEGSAIAFAGTFTDGGSGQTVQWDFGDGTTSTQASPTHSYADDGAYTATFTVTDAGGLIGSDTTTVTVGNVAPTITSGTPPTALTEGTTWTWLPASTDPGADVPTWSATGLPSGMSLTQATGALAWTPAYADVGSHPITLTVDDGDGGTDTQAFTLVVAFLDADGDGMPDTWETSVGLNPTIDDAYDDPDADGIENIGEFAMGTDPFLFDGPTAPVPVAPVGGAEVATAAPALSWTNATTTVGAVFGYDVEVYDDPSMTTLLASPFEVSEDPSGTSSWTVNVTLAENTEAHWRVRAAGTFAPGPWSSLEVFFVNAVEEPPTDPVATAPLDGDRVDTLRPTLSWTASVDPDGDAVVYLVDVTDDAGAVLATAETSAGSWELDVDLLEDAFFTWQVVAEDEHGTLSNPSVRQEFFVSTTNSVPDAVAWLAPEDGAALEDVSPTFRATESRDDEGDPLTYLVELDVAPGFDTAELLTAEFAHDDDGEVIWDLAADGLALREHVDWHARVRAEDGTGGASAWAELTVFVRGPNDAPEVPELLSPEDGVLFDVDARPEALETTTPHDPEGDAVTVEVVVARDAELTDVVDLADVESGLWYWSARATDDLGATSDWATPWTFEIAEAVGDDDDDDDDDDRDPEVGGACDCESSIAGSASSAWAMLLLGVVGVRRRR